ncbi:hypothetical protein JSY36_11495 [Bacillus sp. H-16]|uniref:hypothetical protein n=1 Tax=Alteribacter salitolerans TaxID=2912333 RepID=UPI001966A608|nr:hypothetical protein [Alteribacter salitolerans]MBM7096368.1 hypothetical protein [Alteribacter salitolerans]
MTVFIGFGKLAQAVLHLIPEDRQVRVFSRTKEKVVEACQGDSRITWIEREDFVEHKDIWLFLPKDEVASFIKENKSFFHPQTSIYVTATAVMRKDIESLLPERGNAVPCKFVTQADQLRKDKEGLVIVDSADTDDAEAVKQFLGDRFSVLEGAEEGVLSVNKAATKAAIEAVTTLEKDLRKQGIDEKMIRHAASQIIPGVIRAYLDGELGGFGKQVIKEIEENET